MSPKLKIANWSWLIFFIGIITCIVLLFAGKKALDKTSTDDYCISCHVHPDADNAWKKSAHYYNKSGVRVHCVECHLPPKESSGYLAKKAKTGLKDLYGFYFKDHKTFDWTSKGMREHAVNHVS